MLHQLCVLCSRASSHESVEDHNAKKSKVLPHATLSRCQLFCVYVSGVVEAGGSSSCVSTVVIASTLLIYTNKLYDYVYEFLLVTSDIAHEK
jgi:hypothetical protein